MRTMLLGLSLFVVAPDVHGQELERRLTEEDYAAAERMLAQHTEPLVHRADVAPIWLEDGRFWYATSVPGGREHLLVDPRVPSRAPAFDHARLATALASASGERVGPLDLRVIALDLAGELALLAHEEARYVCRLAEYACGPAPDVPQPRRDEVASPDVSRAAMIRPQDFSVRDVGSG